MKRLILVGILAATLIFGLSACRHFDKGVQGSGVRKTEKRDLAAFTSIETTGAFEIQITCQQAASFEIEGDDNLLELIGTEVLGGVLRIYDKKSYSTSKAISLRIGMANLEKISSTGAANIHVSGLKNDKFAISSTGAGLIQAEGETKYADISSTGAGKIVVARLHADRAKVSVTGAAQVDVYARQQLDVTVSGVGQVNYGGDPPVVNKSVSGMGSVNKKEGGGS